MPDKAKSSSAEAAEDKKEEVTGASDEVVAVPEKFRSIVESIEQLSVLDLSELVKILENKFGVSAAAPMMIAGATAGASEAVAAEEKDSFDVEITSAGATKIAVIKAVRE